LWGTVISNRSGKNWQQVQSMQTKSLLLCSAALFISTLPVTNAHAESRKTCSAGEAKRARLEVAHLQDWKAVYSSFKRIGGCDVRAVAEEYSYAISRLLAHHWDDVGSLLSLASDDQTFKQFVLRHIDENVPEEEAQLIIANSRQHCPANGQWLCSAIVDY
jgi:ABC-type enterochelin transport system substrate-binding protein